MMEFEPVIGLEIHAQLLTQTKIFSDASTQYGAEPNTQASALDIALPGTLPVLNKEAVNQAILFALSVGATIPTYTIFDRKHYFYPDLPKGYQISQHTDPILTGGQISIVLKDGRERVIRIHHAHLEEDAGKSLHENFDGFSGIDLNRAGTPLLEIVSEPDMHSTEEAIAYFKAIHTLVRYLNISDGNMQEGSFRCDVNVSLRPVGQTKLGTRTEVKNINSFRFVEKAIDYEIERQSALLRAGIPIVQETLLFDSVKNETRSLRTKEDAKDYRYFPDPDLLPVRITDHMIEAARERLPELPWEKRYRFEQDYGLSTYDADVLARQRERADYFEAVLESGVSSPKLAANWISSELLAVLNEHNLNITHSPISPAQLAGLIRRVEDETISGKIAKTVFEKMWDTQQEADTIIAAEQLEQITDSKDLENIVDRVIQEYPEQVAEYRAGKDRLFGFFVGQVMKLSDGKASPGLVNDLLKVKLG